MVFNTMESLIDLSIPLSKEEEDLRCLQSIQENWNEGAYWPHSDEVERASRLAYKGKLTEVDYMNLSSHFGDCYIVKADLWSPFYKSSHNSVHSGPIWTKFSVNTQET